jgi:hypothetical protein
VTGESQKLVEEEHERGDVRAYNISSQERIVRGRMPTMEIVNERFLSGPSLFNVTAHFCVSLQFPLISILWPFAPCGGAD